MKLGRYVVLGMIILILISIYSITLGLPECIEGAKAVEDLSIKEDERYNLTINEPIGEGNVEVDGEEVTEWPYERKYENGTEVNVTARPKHTEGWEFKHWGGPSAIGFGQKRRENNISLELNDDKEFSVFFFKVEYVEIEPDDDFNLRAGDSKNFTAEAFGWAYNEENWKIEDEYIEFRWENTTTEDGQFEETKSGRYKVTATYNRVDGRYITSVPTAVTVQPAKVNYVLIEPELDQTIKAGEMIDFSAEAYDRYDNLIMDDDLEFAWENTDGSGLFNETEAGEYDVTASYEGVTSTMVTVTVEPAEVDYVEMDLDEDQIIEAGERIDFSAEAYDEFGNLLEDECTEFTWKNTDQTGLFDKTEAGEYEVTATYEGLASDTVMVTVEPAEVNYIEIDPAEEQTVKAGGWIDFSVEAYDEYDNLITDDDGEFTWENAENGEFYETKVGDYEVLAAYEGISSETIIVTVEPGDVETVEIQPNKDLNVTAGEEIKLSVWANDTYGNVITDDPDEFNWKNAPGGIFERFEAGEYEIKAEYENVQSESITINNVSSVKPPIIFLSVTLTTVVGLALYKRLGGIR